MVRAVNLRRMTGEPTLAPTDHLRLRAHDGQLEITDEEGTTTVVGHGEPQVLPASPDAQDIVDALLLALPGLFTQEAP